MRLPLGLVTVLALALCAGGSALAAKPLPDLIVKKVTVPSNAVGGSTVTFRTNVANQGAGSARASTTTFYLSFDRRLDDNDIEIKTTRKVGRLAHDKASAGATKVEVPAYLTGLFEVLACADTGKKVKESREGNNCRAARAPMTISLPRQA